MSENDTQVNASYHFTSRLKGTATFEQFNDYYLSVTERKLKRTRQFKIELATLNPEAKKTEKIAWHWLAAAIITALGGGLLIYLSGADDILMALLGLAITALITALFSTLFFYHTQRQWVIETRSALYPLVVLPYHKHQQKEAAAFIKSLQQAIETNVSRKRYSSEDLFAGELRMLRRLSKNKVLSDALYEQAKSHMMKVHGNATAA